MLQHRPRLAVIPSLALALFAFATGTARAGGPKFVAGTTFFNPAVAGQPVHWAGGQVNYYVDQGPLSATVTNQQATAMVDAAAALWSAVPTAAVTLTDKGPLNEDVSGSNIVVDTNGQIAQPSDITPVGNQLSPRRHLRRRRLRHRRPLRLRPPASPTSCQNNGVFVWMDNLNPDATIAHAVILLNGLCATNANLHRDDELRAGARLRPRPRPRLLPGQPRRSSERRLPAARRAGR